jgi:hypothetical protein
MSFNGKPGNFVKPNKEKRKQKKQKRESGMSQQLLNSFAGSLKNTLHSSPIFVK